MKTNLLFHQILGMALALILFIGCFSGAFFLTSFIWAKIGQTPSAYIIQLINSLLGLMIMALLIKLGLRFDRQTTGLFDSIIKAQQKIAAGDFHVRLDKDTEGLGAFGELVESVNDLALELSKIEKMRREFISNVSHELQSPLTSIRGFAQALRNNELSTETRSYYLSIIETESMRLSRLSDNLLRLALLEADAMKFEPSVYRLDKQIRRIILACEPHWSEKNITMDVSLEAVEVKADEDMMSQIWINLLQNSIKFTPEGGSVSVCVQQHGNTIVFQVADTGRGIAEEDQHFIFERFFKADKSHTPSLQGSGLGLSIVKKIVEMHRGVIEVQSKLGAGTTFTISLPNGL